MIRQSKPLVQAIEGPMLESTRPTRVVTGLLLPTYSTLLARTSADRSTLEQSVR
jgi:hypothetical protein